MIFNEIEGYYFDKLYINSVKTIGEVKKAPFIEALKNECFTFNMHRSYLSFRGYNYKTRLELTGLTRKALEILKSNEQYLGFYYWINDIELAHDIFCQSEFQAETEANHLFKTLRKKYSYGIIYRAERNPKKRTRVQRLKDRKIRGLIASSTFYSNFKTTYQDNEKVNSPENKQDQKNKGTRNYCLLKLVFYARLSKITKLSKGEWTPCVHFEWRIKGANKIKALAGISTIDDLLNFDFRTFFSKMKERYILYEALEIDKIGKVLTKKERKKQFSYREKLRMDVRTQIFLNCAQIENVTDFKKFTDSVLSVINRMPGRKSEEWKEWARQVKKLSNTARYVKRLQVYTEDIYNIFNSLSFTAL